MVHGLQDVDLFVMALRIRQWSKRFTPLGENAGMGRHCIKTVPLDGVVLDCFAGSGSTGVACLQTGRRFIGIELRRAYFGSPSTPRKRRRNRQGWPSDDPGADALRRCTARVAAPGRGCVACLATREAEDVVAQAFADVGRVHAD